MDTNTLNKILDYNRKKQELVTLQDEIKALRDVIIADAQEVLDKADIRYIEIVPF